MEPATHKTFSALGGQETNSAFICADDFREYLIFASRSKNEVRILLQPHLCNNLINRQVNIQVNIGVHFLFIQVNFLTIAKPAPPPLWNLVFLYQGATMSLRTKVKKHLEKLYTL